MSHVAQQYNYDTFALSAIPAPETFAGPEVREQFIDFEAQTLDGQTVHLSDYTGDIIVLETGSISCPLYADTAEEMNQLIEKFPFARFLLLYTHEAHPGENIPNHSSFTDKLTCAARLSQTMNEGREILVDDIAGTAHRAYGGFPNMLYLIDRDGTVLMRGHWSDPPTLEKALARLQKHESLNGLRFKFRYPNIMKAYKTLRHAGWKAVVDGVLQLPYFAIWHLREQLRGWA